MAMAAEVRSRQLSELEDLNRQVPSYKLSTTILDAQSHCLVPAGTAPPFYASPFPDPSRFFLSAFLSMCFFMFFLSALSFLFFLFLSLFSVIFLFAVLAMFMMAVV
jgi:hypothetical protein